LRFDIVGFLRVSLARDCASDGNRPKDGGRQGQAEKAKDRLFFLRLSAKSNDLCAFSAWAKSPHPSAEASA
jgi:hypothetical protein